MNQEIPERFVDAEEAAEFLPFSRRRILDLARTGKLPCYPVGEGTRCMRLFRLSELAAAIKAMKEKK